MRIHATLAGAAAIFMTVVAYNFIFGGTHTYHGILFEPAAAATPFTLTNVKTGQPFYFEPEPGRVTLLYFGYTQCSDVCPATLAVWKQIKKEMGANVERVRFVFVTVDPERDTPEVLAKYISVFERILWV